MCGRFALTELDPTVIRDAFSVPDVPDLSPRYNIAPTQPVATVVRDADSGENCTKSVRKTKPGSGFLHNPPIHFSKTLDLQTTLYCGS